MNIGLSYPVQKLIWLITMSNIILHVLSFPRFCWVHILHGLLKAKWVDIPVVPDKFRFFYAETETATEQC